MMETNATLLTTDEARAVAGELLDQALGGTRDTSVNMASAYLTTEGEVSIVLLGAVERHASISSFLRAYGISWPDQKDQCRNRKHA